MSKRLCLVHQFTSVLLALRIEISQPNQVSDIGLAGGIVDILENRGLHCQLYDRPHERSWGLIARKSGIVDATNSYVF